MPATSRIALRVLTVALLAAAASCGSGRATPAGAQAPPPAPSALDPVLEGLELRELGPAIMGGRVSALAPLESDPATVYVGLASGGVWRTENQGQSWTPLFDDQPCASVGDVAVYQANANVIWVGTGEPQNRQSSPYGCGIFRSTDGGRSWTQLGLEETRHVGRIVLHPTDPDVAYVAAVGHLWGPNEERGVYRTTDGGETWEKVLYVDENTGAIDLVMDPGDPRTLFAAMYQRRRTAFGFSASGPGSGIWRTLDGGESWEELGEGLPEGDVGRIGLDVYRRDGDLLYAVVESSGDGRGLYRSTDRGESWEKVSDRNPRPMYFSMVRIDPNNPERIYLGGVSLNASDDGGRTWWEGDAAEGIHVDHHALWIDPSDSEHLVLGSDGGVASSWDGARTWEHHDNLPIGQFYEIGTDDSDPYRVCGGLQDNSSWCAPTRILEERSVYRTDRELGVMNRDWFDVWGGDGFYNEFEPGNPDILYTESQGGNLGRVSLPTGESWRIRPLARPPREGEEAEYAFNWNTPVVPSVHTPGTVYVGADHVLASRDRGITWREISPDLTRQVDRDTLPIMGAPVTDSTLSGNDGIASYGNITALAESPVDSAVLWAGTDDGNLHVTRDRGETWTDVVSAVPGLPGPRYVSRVEPSHHEAGRAYVTFDGHYDDDYAPYVFVTEDHGATWRRITSGLPDESVNVIREHPATPDLLFLGNEVGVFVSVDRGGSWHRLPDLPTVPVDDLDIQERENDLVVGTHGRSIWILPGLAPLQQVADGSITTDTYLFPVPRATHWFTTGGWPFWGDQWAAEPAPDGAVIRYLLQEEVDSLSLEIADPLGQTVRRLEGPRSAGLHQVEWDLREGLSVETDDEEDAPAGAQVLPGTYFVRLTAGGDVAEQEVEVRMDPRVDTELNALRMRQEAARSAALLGATVQKARGAVDRLRGQLEEAATLLREAGADSALVVEAETMHEELDSLREALAEAAPGRAAAGIEANAGPPTADQRYALERGWEEVPLLVEDVNDYVTERLPGLYRRMDQAGIRPDPGEPVEIPDPPGGGAG